MDFRYKTNSKSDRQTLTLSGRLDTLSAAELEHEVKRIIAQPGKSVEVEISGLSYISSSGLRCFIVLLKGCKAAGAELIITGVQPAIREIFDLTGFTKIFGIN